MKTKNHAITDEKGNVTFAESPEVTLAELRALEARGRFLMFPFRKLHPNPSNPREPLTAENTADVARDMAGGYQRTKPFAVEVSKDIEGMSDDDVRKLAATIIRGNRRHFALAGMTPAERSAILSGDDVPVFVFSGLTPGQRELLINDHGTDGSVRGQNEWEKFLSVRNLVAAGIRNRMAVAGRLKQYAKTKDGKAQEPAGPWAQTRISLALLPPDVQEAFRPVLMGDIGKSKLRLADVPTLYRLYNNLSRTEFAAAFVKFQRGTHPECVFKKKGKKTAPAPAGPKVDYDSVIRSVANALKSAKLREIVESAEPGELLGKIDAYVSRLEANAAKK